MEVQVDLVVVVQNLQVLPDLQLHQVKDLRAELEVVLQEYQKILVAVEAVLVVLVEMHLEMQLEELEGLE
jgi:hypothetical protein